MENPEKCEWNEIDRLKRPNRLKRTTFSSTPVFLVIFRLGRPKICVPFIFYPELPESLVVYHLHQKPIWFQTVQMERKNFDWKIPFGARAFHFP